MVGIEEEAAKLKFEVAAATGFTVADTGKEGTTKPPESLEGLADSPNCCFCWREGEDEVKVAGDRIGSSAENGSGGRGDGLTEGGLGVTLAVSILMGFDAEDGLAGEWRNAAGPVGIPGNFRTGECSREDAMDSLRPVLGGESCH